MQFTDSSTSSPDTIVSWSWDFGDGGSSSDQNPSHTFMDDGVYTVRLTVTDDDGSTDYIEHSVTVNDLAPTAGFSDNGPQDEGSVVSFTDASTSYPDPIVSWSWDFGDGGSSSDQNPSHTFMDDGVYTVRLTVTDEDGSTDTVSHDVTVSDLGPTAAFDWSPKPQDEGSAVSFTDSSSSYPDTIVSWSWDFAGLGTSTAKNPSFTFMDDGVYTVRLTVTDEDGSTDTVIHDVAVNNVAPTLYSIGSQSTLWGEELYFDANAYDPGDDVITFSLEGTIPLGAAIDSDDGEFRWTPTAGQVGTHTFTVKVTDDDEEYDEEEITVTVGKRATTLVYNGDSSEQYSDETSLSATLSGEPSGMTGYSTLQGNTITFTIGTQSTSGTTNTGGVATALLVINQASGSYTVESEFAGDDYYLPSSDSDPYIINKETAIVSYTGSTEVSTAGTAVTEAAIRLAATVTEAYDGYVGNLALAKVVFTIAGTTYESKPFREVIGNVPVDSSGNALATAIIPAGAYTIDVDIESSNLFWESEIDSTALLVDIGDGKQTVSGGGWIPSEDSINGKINFAFTVQYNKKGDPKGSFVAVFKSTDGFIYKIKSTSWAKAGLSFTDEDEAFFTCTGVVQKIDRATGEEIESWGNAKVMVDVKDGDVQFPQNGGTDTIAITVTDNSYSVLFQWGTKAEPITIGGGNITVKNTEEKVIKTK